MPKKHSEKQFTLIAHRGASYDAPENTFEAFDLALEMGFDNIETDVQLSSDGRCVLIHDEFLDRTTGIQGLVAETSIAKIKSLNAGLWFEGPDDGAVSTSEKLDAIVAVVAPLTNFKVTKPSLESDPSNSQEIVSSPTGFTS